MKKSDFTPLKQTGENQRKWVALLGNPNCGKTAIFNLLTGLNQKVSNYPGITVEKKIGAVVNERKKYLIY
jgi:ferrous iron transport protein B